MTTNEPAKSGTGVAPLPWARQPISTEPPATPRARRQVDSLPAWEPLPPGEILVQRGRHS
jgi:hypothetical protein